MAFRIVLFSNPFPSFLQLLVLFEPRDEFFQLRRFWVTADAATQLFLLQDQFVSFAVYPTFSLVVSTFHEATIFCHVIQSVTTITFELCLLSVRLPNQVIFRFSCFD